MTADLWINLPSVLDGLTSEKAIRLGKAASRVIDHGGTVTLHFLSARGGGAARS